MRLKHPEKPIPGGDWFYDPLTGYRAEKNTPRSQIVDGVIAARLANPAITNQHHLATDRHLVEREVEQFLCQAALAMGAHDYVDTRRDPALVPGGMPLPFPQAPPQLSLLERLRSVAAGAEILVHWLASREEAVPQEQANQRASICAACPFNNKGDLSEFFTVPVSNAIRKALKVREGWNLKTPFDDTLEVCQVCLCPLKLKVFCPAKFILDKMPEEVFNELHEKCWLRSEKGK
jgi:hypothetical protein